jgi:hypothetical protein
LDRLAREMETVRSARKLRVGFLLGAGVSEPAQAPSTAVLTQTVLQESHNYYIHSDERWYERARDTTVPPDKSQRELRVRRLLTPWRPAKLLQLGPPETPPPLR